jgi:hypothetical protein
VDLLTRRIVLQIRAIKAAERGYQQTARDSGHSEADVWISAVMFRLRSHVTQPNGTKPPRGGVVKITSPIEIAFTKNSGNASIKWRLGSQDRRLRHHLSHLSLVVYKPAESRTPRASKSRLIADARGSRKK